MRLKDYLENTGKASHNASGIIFSSVGLNRTPVGLFSTPVGLCKRKILGESREVSCTARHCRNLFMIFMEKPIRLIRSYEDFKICLMGTITFMYWKGSLQKDLNGNSLNFENA